MCVEVHHLLVQVFSTRDVGAHLVEILGRLRPRFCYDQQQARVVGFSKWPNKCNMQVFYPSYNFKGKLIFVFICLSIQNLKYIIQTLDLLLVYSGTWSMKYEGFMIRHPPPFKAPLALASILVLFCIFSCFQLSEGNSLYVHLTRITSLVSVHKKLSHLCSFIFRKCYSWANEPMTSSRNILFHFLLQFTCQC